MESVRLVHIGKRRDPRYGLLPGYTLLVPPTGPWTTEFITQNIWQLCKRTAIHCRATSPERFASIWSGPNLGYVSTSYVKPSWRGEGGGAALDTMQHVRIIVGEESHAMFLAGTSPATQSSISVCHSPHSVIGSQRITMIVLYTGRRYKIKILQALYMADIGLQSRDSELIPNRGRTHLATGKTSAEWRHRHTRAFLPEVYA